MQEQAENYARKAVCSLAHTKGFPLSAEQILGYVAIYTAYRKASNILYLTKGEELDGETFFGAIYDDFMDFVDTDIPLQPSVCATIYYTYTTHKLTALYVFHNNIDSTNEVVSAYNKIAKLIEKHQWGELNTMIGVEELWQEI